MLKYAEEGKVWKSKREGWIGSEILVLGANDSLENYEQIYKPIEESENSTSGELLDVKEENLAETVDNL